MTLNGLSGKGLMYCCFCLYIIAYYVLLVVPVALMRETRGFGWCRRARFGCVYAGGYFRRREGVGGMIKSYITV